MLDKNGGCHEDPLHERACRQPVLGGEVLHGDPRLHEEARYSGGCRPEADRCLPGGS